MEAFIHDCLQWLFSNWDSSRQHHIDFASQWHARSMFMAWGIIIPCGILIARFFKVTPRQNFPHELDNKLWWHSHLFLQVSGCVLAFLSVLFILYYNSHVVDAPIHRLLGWTTMGLMLVQILLGCFRGSKGGPTYPGPDGSWHGDHYDMTGYRYFFEYTHKILGYVVLLCAWATTLSGLWYVNSPKGMVILMILFWLMLIIVFIVLQCQGRVIDTYQAIWGTSPEHLGNNKKNVGFGVKRLPHTEDYVIEEIKQSK